MRKIFIPLAFLLSFCLPAALSAQDQLTQKGGYSTNLDEEHYYLFVLSNRASDLQELRTGITKYIWKYHPNEKLKITQITIDGDLKDVPLIHVTGFATKAQALAFHNGVKTNRPDFMQMGMTKENYPLSKSNYETVVRTKSLNGYKVFFQQNY